MRRHPPVEHFGDLWHLGECRLPLPGLPASVAWVGCIDVASGLVVYSALYPLRERERLEETLQWAILCRGVPEALSLEDGRARRSHRFHSLSRALELPLLGRPSWMGCARLHHLFWQGERDYLPHMERLRVTNLRLASALLHAWADLVYHLEVHPHLARTPLEAFRADPAPRATPIGEEAVRQAFTRTIWRRVTAAGTFSFQGRRYAVLPHLAGQRVQLRYWSGDPDTVEVWLPSQEGLHFQQVALPLTPEPEPPPFSLGPYWKRLPRFAREALDHLGSLHPPEAEPELHHGLSGLAWEELVQVQQPRQVHAAAAPEATGSSARLSELISDGRSG